MQRGQVVTYVSRQLKPHEDNYLTRDLELETIMFALKVFHHYLYWVHFEMFSNHKILKYPFDQNELNMRQRRWMEYSNEFNFELKYYPGKENKVADALSQKEMHTKKLMILEHDLLEKFQNLNY